MKANMNPKDLQEVLRLHELWLAGDPGGSCANLCGANLYRANLSDVNLYGANLCGANLYRANLYRANLCRANLNRANLSYANLYRANLNRANLSDANLYRADLNRANLSDVNLYGAKLNRANLSDANLNRANLNRTNLSNANLNRANLSDVNLYGANLDYASWPLWCGSLTAKIDRQIAAQLAYHLLSVWPEERHGSILTLANEFHRIPKLLKLNETKDSDGQIRPCGARRNEDDLPSYAPLGYHDLTPEDE